MGSCYEEAIIKAILRRDTDWLKSLYRTIKSRQEFYVPLLKNSEGKVILEGKILYACEYGSYLANLILIEAALLMFLDEQQQKNWIEERERIKKEVRKAFQEL